MRTQINFFLVILISVLSTITLTAQDLIHKKNKEIIEAKVIESSMTELKYRNYNDEEGVIYVIDKSLLTKVEYENGTTDAFLNGGELIDNPEVYLGQADQLIKVSFFGPIIGYTNFIYERNLAPGRSWEAKLSVIGLGFNGENTDRGAIGSFSYKLYRKPNYYQARSKRAHLMQGGYIRPELFIGHVAYDEREYNYLFSEPEIISREKSVVGGFLINIGKQWVFGDSVVFDIAAGMGYGKGKSSRAFFVNSTDGDVGLAGSVTMNIGWAF